MRMNIKFLWKCHKETPCVAILRNKNVSFFFIYKTRKQEGETGPEWRVWY
jgi:hypothetical protein